MLGRDCLCTLLPAITRLYWKYRVRRMRISLNLCNDVIYVIEKLYCRPQGGTKKVDSYHTEFGGLL